MRVYPAGIGSSTFSNRTAVTLNSGILASGSRCSALVSQLTEDAGKWKVLKTRPRETRPFNCALASTSPRREMTRTMYGVVRFDDVAAEHLLGLLPQVINIDAWDDQTGGWLQSTLRFIASEAASLKPGGETVINSLSGDPDPRCDRRLVERDGQWRVLALDN